MIIYHKDSIPINLEKVLYFEKYDSDVIGMGYLISFEFEKGVKYWKFDKDKKERDQIFDKILHEFGFKVQ